MKIRAFLQDFSTNVVKSSFLSVQSAQYRKKSGVVVEALYPRLREYSQSKRAFCEKGAAADKVKPYFRKNTANRKARRDVVGNTGFEPAASSSRTKRATKLR